jgi:serpin B
MAMRRLLDSLMLPCAILVSVMALSACGGSGGTTDTPPTDTTPPPRVTVPVNELRSSKQRTTSPMVSSDEAATFAHDNLAFSIDLYLALRSGNSGNLVFSQTSISTALAMLYAGAGTTTAVQMGDTLHFSLPAPRLHTAFNALDLALTTPPPAIKANAFRLTIANSIWIQEGFVVLPTYLDTLAENYDAGLYLQDFKSAPEPARAAINSWVANLTDNQIPTLFPEGSFDTRTRLVLANAVYFHGDWRVPFLKDSPIAIFHALAGDVFVPTMHSDHNAGIWRGPGWSAGVIDYVGATSSMIIVVPDAGTFADFEAGLTPELLSAILAGAPPTGSADLVLPRFKIATDLPLKETLSAMGMPEAFSETAADFSGIDGERDLYVQQVIHKAIIAVDETGTTASAATGGSAAIASMPPTLVADRPFLFFIRHNPTGAILFQGRVVDPSMN